MARKKRTSNSASRSAAGLRTTTKQNRNLVKQILGRWSTQRKAKITLPTLPALSIDAVPSAIAATPLIQRRGRERSKQPEKQSVDKIARREKICKTRPDSKKAQKGTGGSKEFVPWCK